MNNPREKAEISYMALITLVGGTGKDFGLAYNNNEWSWLTQNYQVYKQRKNESEKFWYWLRNPHTAPQWFQDESDEIRASFESSMVDNDDDLTQHIRQYLADLNSGKKVVIVAHSQGNFYANNAYRYISANYSQYKDSIGIVSVATPATWVEGRLFNHINDVYTTNPRDTVIQVVEQARPDTLDPNVPPKPDNYTTVKKYHGFVKTYLEYYPDRIKNQILNRIASLKTPPKDFACQEPEEVPVSVITTQAGNISATSARLYGYVNSGKSIAGYCIWRKTTSGNPATCWSWRDKIDTSGSRDTGENIVCTANRLTPGTNYKYRVCGRQGDRISDGGISSFTTGGAQCGSGVSYNGGSEGLSVMYAMGSQSGYAKVEFQAYSIPDKLEIWQGSDLVYTTKECGIFGCDSGFVSGHHDAQVFYNPYYGNTWEIRVYGNDDTSTAWNVKISCPE